MFFQQSYEEKKPFILYHGPIFLRSRIKSASPTSSPCRIYFFPESGFLQSVYHPKHRRLSTSRSADHRQKFAFFHNNAHIINALYLPKLFVTCSRRIISIRIHSPVLFCFFSKVSSNGSVLTVFGKIFYSNGRF